MNMNSSPTEFYKTSDFKEMVILKLMGVDVATIENEGPRVYMVFHNLGICENILLDFANEKIQVEANKFFNYTNRIKELVNGYRS